MATLAPDSLLSEQVFSRGIVRDSARNAIPLGGVYDATDLLFDIPGKVYKRGGSSFQHTALAGEVQIIAVACPEFPGYPKVVVVATDGAESDLYDVTTSTPSLIGDVTAVPTENPSLYVDKLILCDGFNDSAPQKVYLTGSTVTLGLLGGSPPTAKCSCVHLSYLVLANSDTYPNRLWFSPAPNIESAWDTTEAYIDVAEEITGLASIQGVLLVFCRGQVWRVLGSVPPGTVGENMSLQPVDLAVGCIDARSIVRMGGLVYFAGESGVYSTNGGAPASITSRPDGSGIGSLWSDAIDGYSPVLGSVVCAGVWLNKHLFVTVRHASSDSQSGARYQFLYHEPTGAWTRLSDGVTADMYATANAPVRQIYAAGGDSSDAVRLLKLSGLFSPASGNKADANGDAITPTITFRTMQPGPGLKAWGWGHLTFDMRDAASDNPTLAVATAPGLEATTFATARTLSETTDADRQRFVIARDAQALTVKLTQAGNSSKTEIYALEVEVRPYDQDSEGE